MTFREKIKSILHSGHKKSIPNASAPAPSPTPAAAPAVTNSDPNKPPNSRDPGFRKSFNLGEPTPTNGSAKTEARDIGSSNSQGATGNGNTRSHMYTLDKYGEDYLAVSPRTNVTVQDGNTANRGLASCPPLGTDESPKTGLVNTQERDPKDTVAGAAKALDGLPGPQQNPDFGRERFAGGERKDSGFVEPVPTRDATVPPSPKPEHPTSFDLESSPPAAAIDPECQEIAAATNPKPAVSNHVSPSAGLPETKFPSLLVPHTLEDGTSSVYSDDSTRPALQQIASSDYGPLVESPDLKATSPAPITASAAEHQKGYSLLVSQELPIVEEANSQVNSVSAKEKEPLPAIDEKADLLTVVRSSFGEPSAAGAISPSILPADETNTWSQDLLANIDKIQSDREEREKERVAVNSDVNGVNNIPDTAPFNSEASIDVQAAAFADIVTAHLRSLQPAREAPISSSSVDQQAAAFADIIMAHVGSAKSINQGAENQNAHPLPVLLPQNQKPIVTTTNTVPHADAEHMGDDVPGVPVTEGKSPIVTTTNTVPHGKVIPVGADGGDGELPKLSRNESVYSDWDKAQNDSGLDTNERPLGDEDSVYEVTKEIPGAF